MSLLTQDERWTVLGQQVQAALHREVTSICIQSSHGIRSGAHHRVSRSIMECCHAAIDIRCSTHCFMNGDAEKECISLKKISSMKMCLRSNL